MAGEGAEGEGSPGIGTDPAEGEESSLSDELVSAAGDSVVHPAQTPPLPRRKRLPIRASGPHPRIPGSFFLSARRCLRRPVPVLHKRL
jgi:hypothetical protein